MMNNDPIYGKPHPFTIGPNHLYMIQSVTRGMETTFIITRSGEYLCTVSINENAQWEADQDIAPELLAGIEREIKRSYE